MASAAELEEKKVEFETALQVYGLSKEASEFKSRIKKIQSKMRMETKL